MADKFSNYATGLVGAGGDFNNVTPDDDTDLDPLPRALFIATGGTVVMINATGGTVTFVAPNGVQFSGRPTRLMETGTSASGFVAFY